MKQLINVFISVVLFANLLPFANAFSDVPKENPYFNAVEFLKEKEIVDSHKKFFPNNIITKAEFLKMAFRNIGYKPPKNKKFFLTPFKDVPRSIWYAPYVREAFKLGVIPRNKKFFPNKPIKRWEALKIVFFIEGIPVPKTLGKKLKFKDIKKESEISPVIGKAVEMQVMDPVKETYFGVKRKLTRGEAADLLYRITLIGDSDIELFSSDNNPFEKSFEQIQNNIPNLNTFKKVWSLISQNFLYKKNIDKENMMYSAIEGMVGSLGDPHSIFFRPEKNKNFSDDLSGEIEGIGAYVSKENGKIIIVAPLKGSPAEKAGIKPKDIILKINGEDASEMDLGKAVSKIKGKKGTAVVLTIMRNNNMSLDISIVRDVIDIKSVIWEKRGDTAILDIIQFSADTLSEFQKAVEEISVLDPKVEKLVLDLRNNPGGFLNVAIDILGFFFEDNIDAVKVQYLGDSSSFKTSGPGTLKDFRIVVLINGGSASASEIVAGALQDYNKATILGTTSFGKGTVQELIELDKGASLKLSIAKWLTPKNRFIDGAGITPDVVIKNPESGTTDYQLERALQILR